MSLTIAALWHQLTGRAAPPHWTFEVDRSRAPLEVAWRWLRHDPDGQRIGSPTAFPTFSSCARTAGGHGFLASHPYRLQEKEEVSTDWSRPRDATDLETHSDAA